MPKTGGLDNIKGKVRMLESEAKVGLGKPVAFYCKGVCIFVLIFT